MIQVKVIKATGSVTGTTYTVTTHVEAWDYTKKNDEWLVATTDLITEGPITDTATAVKKNVIAVVGEWKKGLDDTRTLSDKIATLEGMVL